jgi:hypothetical protein
METRTYRTVNIPPETWEEAAKRTSDYTIAFGKLTEQAVVDADLGGSGTLVKVDGKHGILTAAHVLDQIWKSERFALVLPGFPSGHPHTLLFETASLKKVQVSRPMHLDVSEPPDLALVELPPHQVGNISARKSFYNISKHQNEALSAPPECRLGFWVMSGFASEWTADAAATPGCARLVVVNGRILGVSVIPLQTDSEFDGWRGLFERGED